MKKIGIKIVLLLIAIFVMGGNNNVSAKSKDYIKLNFKSKTISVGDKVKLKVKKSKPKKLGKKVKWKSSNKKIATVNKNGIVTAKKNGTVKIYAISLKNKKIKAYCKLVIKKKEIIVPKNSQNEKITTKSSDTIPKEIATSNVPESSTEGNKIPVRPMGLCCVSNTDDSHYFVWQPVETADFYNLYVDNVKVESNIRVYGHIYVGVLSKGIHIISVTAENTYGESDRTTIEYIINGDVEPTTEEINISETESSGSEKYNITFCDYDGSVIKSELLEKDSVIIPPENPTRGGYKFVKWDKTFYKAEKDISIKAVYEEISEPVIYGDVVNTNNLENENIVVPFFIKNNPGLLGMTLSVNYDEDNLQLIDYEIGNAFQNVLVLTGANVLNSGCKFVFDGQELGTEDVRDGTVILFTFKTNSNVEKKKYVVNLSYINGDIIDADLNPVSVIMQNATINVK